MIRNVLHVIYDDPANPWVGGGGAVRLFEIYRRLAATTNVTIVTGNFPGARDEIIDGVNYVRRGARRPYSLSRLTFGAAASWLLRGSRYDAAIFDFSAYSPVRIPRNRAVGIMLGQLVSGSSGKRWGRAAGNFVAKFERSQLKRARAVCAVSRALADEVRPYLAQDATMTVAGAGVGDDLFQIQRSESNYFAYLGRFDFFQKGLDVLLAAMAIHVNAGNLTRLKIMGRGRDEGRVRAMIASLGLKNSVDVLVDPSREVIRSTLAGALAVLVPSRFEGFGMVAAEAMAAAAPVIGSDIPALREVIDPPRGGIVTKEGDAPALAEAMRRIGDDRELRQQLSTASRERAQRFSWNRVADDHSSFIDQVASLAPGSSVFNHRK